MLWQNLFKRETNYWHVQNDFMAKWHYGKILKDLSKNYAPPNSTTKLTLRTSNSGFLLLQEQESITHILIKHRRDPDCSHSYYTPLRVRVEKRMLAVKAAMAAPAGNTSAVQTLFIFHHRPFTVRLTNQIDVSLLKLFTIND